MAIAEPTPAEFTADVQARIGRIAFNELIRDDIVPIVRAQIQDNFDRAQTASGTPWPPHAPSTVRRYGPHPLLVLSGALERAATRAGANHVENVEGDTLRYGVSGIVYAATHQYGDMSRNIPQREYMALSEDTVERIANIAGNYAAYALFGGY